MKKIIFLFVLLLMPLSLRAWTYVFKNEVQSPIEITIDFNRTGKRSCPAIHFFLARKGSEFEDTREKPSKIYMPGFKFVSECAINKITAKRLMTDDGRPIQNPQIVVYTPSTNASCTIKIVPERSPAARSGYVMVRPVGSDSITFEEEKIFEYSPTYSKFKYNKGD